MKTGQLLGWTRRALVVLSWGALLGSVFNLSLWLFVSHDRQLLFSCGWEFCAGLIGFWTLDRTRELHERLRAEDG